MELRFVSDLHLESNHIVFPDASDSDQTLLMIGDIVAGQRKWDRHLMDNINDLIQWANGFKKAIWVPGNHEYNNFDSVSSCHSFFRNMIDSLGGNNIRFCSMGCDVDNDVAIIWATLWTNFNDDWSAKQACKNFHDFESNPELNPDSVSRISNEQLAFINSSAYKYKQEGKKVVVATHFPPSLSFSSPRGVKTDAYFYRNCEFMFPDVDVWLYGHCHTNKNFESDLIKICSNQLGYGHESDGFYIGRTVSI